MSFWRYGALLLVYFSIWDGVDGDSKSDIAWIHSGIAALNMTQGGRLSDDFHRVSPTITSWPRPQSGNTDKKAFGAAPTHTIRLPDYQADVVDRAVNGLNKQSLVVISSSEDHFDPTTMVLTNSDYELAPLKRLASKFAELIKSTLKTFVNATIGPFYSGKEYKYNQGSSSPSTVSEVNETPNVNKSSVLKTVSFSEVASHPEVSNELDMASIIGVPNHSVASNSNVFRVPKLSSIPDVSSIPKISSSPMLSSDSGVTSLPEASSLATVTRLHEVDSAINTNPSLFNLPEILYLNNYGDKLHNNVYSKSQKMLQYLAAKRRQMKRSIVKRSIPDNDNDDDYEELYEEGDEYFEDVDNGDEPELSYDSDEFFQFKRKRDISETIDQETVNDYPGERGNGDQLNAYTAGHLIDAKKDYDYAGESDLEYNEDQFDLNKARPRRYGDEDMYSQIVYPPTQVDSITKKMNLRDEDGYDENFDYQSYVDGDSVSTMNDHAVNEEEGDSKILQEDTHRNKRDGLDNDNTTVGMVSPSLHASPPTLKDDVSNDDTTEEALKEVTSMGIEDETDFKVLANAISVLQRESPVNLMMTTHPITARTEMENNRRHTEQTTLAQNPKIFSESNQGKDNDECVDTHPYEDLMRVWWTRNGSHLQYLSRMDEVHNLHSPLAFQWDNAGHNAKDSIHLYFEREVMAKGVFLNKKTNILSAWVEVLMGNKWMKLTDDTGQPKIFKVKDNEILFHHAYHATQLKIYPEQTIGVPVYYRPTVVECSAMDWHPVK